MLLLKEVLRNLPVSKNLRINFMKKHLKENNHFFFLNSLSPHILTYPHMHIYVHTYVHTYTQERIRDNCSYYVHKEERGKRSFYILAVATSLWVDHSFLSKEWKIGGKNVAENDSGWFLQSSLEEEWGVGSVSNTPLPKHSSDVHLGSKVALYRWEELAGRWRGVSPSLKTLKTI